MATTQMLMTETSESQLDDALMRVCASLQLTATQYKLAKDRYEAVGKWLEVDGSLVAHFRPWIHAQGSLAIGTTVRPVKHTEYDLDLVCLLLAGRGDLIPNQVLRLIEERLRESGTYRSKIERKPRCIRLVFANDFHMDIMPAVPDTVTGGTCILVPDRELKCWKPSNPLGFAKWFEARAALAKLTKGEKFAMAPLPAPETAEEKAPLKMIVQLLKRWRDLAYAQDWERAPISIVLTTLAGLHYDGEISLSRGMMRVLDGIVHSIPRQGRLVVLNPSNAGEDLSERWDKVPGAYQAFVSGITKLRDAWAHLINLQPIHVVSPRVETLFGVDVVRSAIRAQALDLKGLRSSGGLGVQGGTGLLVAAGPGITSVKEHVFHGEVS